MNSSFQLTWSAWGPSGVNRFCFWFFFPLIFCFSTTLENRCSPSISSPICVFFFFAFYPFLPCVLLVVTASTRSFSFFFTPCHRLFYAAFRCWTFFFPFSPPGKRAPDMFPFVFLFLLSLQPVLPTSEKPVWCNSVGRSGFVFPPRFNHVTWQGRPPARKPPMEFLPACFFSFGRRWASFSERVRDGCKLIFSFTFPFFYVNTPPSWFLLLRSAVPMFLIPPVFGSLRVVRSCLRVMFREGNGTIFLPPFLFPPGLFGSCLFADAGQEYSFLCSPKCEVPSPSPISVHLVSFFFGFIRRPRRDPSFLLFFRQTVFPLFRYRSALTSAGHFLNIFSPVVFFLPVRICCAPVPAFPRLLT